VDPDLVQQQMSRHIQDVHQIPKEQLSLDPLVNLNTLLTGALPLEHGIRSSRWKESQKIVSAYVSETSGRLLGNIMDGSRQLFTEAPLTVSLASSKQLAYSSLTRDSSDKVYGFLENGAIQSSLEGLKYSESEINGEISRIAILFNIRASSVSIGVDEIGIVVSDNKGRVRLSFEKDMDLIVGILFFRSIDNILKSPSLETKIKDSVPDYFSISVSGFERFQPESQAVLLNLFKVLFSESRDSFASIYQTRIASFLIAIQTPELSSQFHLVDHDLLSRIDTTCLPLIYSEFISDDPRQLCEDLRRGVPEIFTVACPSSPSFATLASTVNSKSAENEVAIYQIVLWFSIAFAVVIFTSVYALAFMDNKMDASLYTRLNPGSAQKKFQ